MKNKILVIAYILLPAMPSLAEHYRITDLHLDQEYDSRYEGKDDSIDDEEAKIYTGELGLSFTGDVGECRLQKFDVDGEEDEVLVNARPVSTAAGNIFVCLKSNGSHDIYHCTACCGSGTDRRAYVPSVLANRAALSILDGLNGISSSRGLDQSDFAGPIISMEAVEGKSVQLPCNVSAPTPGDKVYMVLWFKADTGLPLYRLDVRGTSLDQAHHESDTEVFGTRAYFRTSITPAALVVKDIRRHDQGLYRCRVDFRNSATRSFRYNLTIIIPPERPVILDRYGQPLNDSLGPHTEGDDVVISCRVIGGIPEPKVKWLRNGKPVDDAYEMNAGDVIENKLTWRNVTRQDLNAMFTCQATNTELTDPQESSIILDMRLRPLEIKLFGIDIPLTADKRYEITCVSSGSRPPAIITWYNHRNRQLLSAKESTRENSTRSELTFVPTIEDNAKAITCRAENPSVAGLYLESKWMMNVIYAPIVTLKLGSTLIADDIKEGDDVYFECHVKANPGLKKLNWIHNGVILSHNSSARIIITHHSLVLQKLTRYNAGRYFCVATNSEGETFSNELIFRIKYAPTCRYDRTMVIGASRSESLEIACEVDADPPVDNFRWKFNNSGETILVPPERFTYNGSVSVLNYLAAADNDYGTLSCWAQNAIGMQVTPCVYQLVAAGKPHSVQNCTLTNQTSSSVEVKCHPGYDGGLPQVFVLEVYTPYSTSPIHNLTESDYPKFHLTDLQPDVIFKIVVSAVNSKGRSQPITLEDFSFRDPEKRTADSLNIKNMSSVLGIAVATLLGVIILIVIIFSNVWRSHNTFFRRRRINDDDEGKHDQITATPIVGNHCDDMNPDIIPAKYEPMNSKRRSSYGLTITNNVQLPKSTWDNDQMSQCLLLDPSSTFSKVNNIQYQSSGDAFCRSSESISSLKAKTSTIIRKKEDDLNCSAIKETLMANRLPESCV